MSGVDLLSCSSSFSCFGVESDGSDGPSGFDDGAARFDLDADRGIGLRR